jgi:hypothetical protein
MKMVQKREYLVCTKIVRQLLIIYSFFMLYNRLAAPGEDSTSTSLTRPTDLSAPSAFTQVLAQVHSPKSGVTHYSASNLPPRPPFTGPQHLLKKDPGAVPHDPHAYYPAENYN